jgi:hypothetical protein
VTGFRIRWQRNIELARGVYEAFMEHLGGLSHVRLAASMASKDRNEVILGDL